ncbi:MAG: response regulator [bacterium]|nr:response regulator [bacterium]
MTRLLIVDDESGYREILSLYARRLGHEVESAEDADAALTHGLRFQPQILFVDWLLASERDGLDVAQELGAQVPEMVTIVTSGNPALELTDELMATGRCSTLLKPFSLSDFECALNEAIVEP